MKNIKIFGLAAGTVGSLILAGTAPAGFEGMFWEYNPGSMAGFDTYRIYATVSSGGELDAVFGDADSPLRIETHLGGGFYQNAFGGPTSVFINPALYPVFPSLVYDSWVTIGLEDQVGNALLDIGIDWVPFEGGGAIKTNNGSWFATPDNPQVHDPGNGRILIGQFTVTQGDWIVGTISMQGKDVNGVNWQARDVAFKAQGDFPAPGALALLGLAGLVGRRRRK